jgi:hypothetical protein
MKKGKIKESYRIVGFRVQVPKEFGCGWKTTKQGKSRVDAEEWKSNTVKARIQTVSKGGWG